jgi:UDP-2,4-diacetamido-2,4,6-trideoxy-beta-L-altropyranose hydrolase
MRLAIRVDASATIGTGHLVRCLTLAACARRRDHEVVLAAADPAPAIADIAAAADLPLLVLPPLGPGEAGQAQDAAAFRRAVGETDITLVDHYGLDAAWEAAVGGPMAVIDDLADRPHDCDLLIDQNPYLNGAARYDGRVPARCERLTGPRYALLRGEFIAAAAHVQPRPGAVERLLVFYGGIDASGETLIALEALSGLGDAAPATDVVVGAANPHLEAVRRAVAADPRVTLHVQTNCMAELTAGADLALGAGGSASLERCRLALPALVTITADNQRELSVDLQAVGAHRILGDAGVVHAAGVVRALQSCFNDPETVRRMSRDAGRVFPADGPMGPGAVMDRLEQVAGR